MDSQVKYQVTHYMQKLEKETRDDKILRYLRKLHEIPITIDVLVGTGVGKLVNKLKKAEGEVGKFAQKLVLQWKEMVSKQRSEEKRIGKKTEYENPYVSFSKTSVANDPSDYDPSNSYRDYKDFKSQPKNDYLEKSTNCDKKYLGSDRYKDSQKTNKVKSKNELSNTEKSSEKGVKLSTKRKHGIKNKIKQKDNLDNQTASFEACLGFNDILPIKRRKTYSSSTSSSQHKSSASNKKSNDNANGESNKSIKSSSSSNDYEKPFLDISSTLPEIQPDYKPTPRYDLLPPTGSSSYKSASRHDVVDDKMFSSAKSSRTKLYSGRASHFEPKLFTLQELCLRVLTENISDIEVMGNVPYFLIKPVLENCTAQQLFAIEYYNPYLVEDTNELWQILSIKDFRKRTPDEMESWREMYLRLSDEREQKLKSITANISASMAKASPVRQTKLAYVDSVAKPPRDVARAQAKRGTGLPVGYAMKSGPPGERTARPKAPAINTASSNSSSHAAHKKKSVAPLMQKSLNFMKNRFRR